MDVGEPSVSGQEVTLRSDTLGVKTATTTEVGEFEFTSVAPGTYLVQLMGDAGQVWVATYPDRVLQGTMETKIDVTATSASNVDFGLFPVDSLARYRGTVVRDGSLISHELSVEAIVNNRACSFPSGLRSSDASPGAYSIAVASDVLVPGCGKPGDIITFQIDGARALQSETWEIGLFQIDLSVTTPPSTEPTSVPEASAEARHPVTISPPDTGSGGLLRITQ
jgi:hypothetical protein